MFGPAHRWSAQGLDPKAALQVNTHGLGEHGLCFFSRALGPGLVLFELTQQGQCRDVGGDSGVSGSFSAISVASLDAICDSKPKYRAKQRSHQ